jgi:RNA 3'-terminal phosphate cyclase
MKGLEGARIVSNYAETLSTGTYMVLWATYANTVIGADVLGERGLRSEEVSRRCVQLLKTRMDNPIDPHAADNIIPYIAMAGGRVRCGYKTEHIKNNIETCSRFGLDVRMEGGVISCEGA